MGRRVFLLLTALSLSLNGAGDGVLDRATLRGVTAVNVVLDPIAPELQKEGATASALRTRLEDKLREGGITIDPAGTEFVGLRVRSVRSARGPFAIAVTIGFYQSVTLVRDPTVKTATQTWEIDTIALADAKQVYRACVDSVDELVARFLAAHSSVNPPREATPRAPGK